MAGDPASAIIRRGSRSDGTEYPVLLGEKLEALGGENALLLGLVALLGLVLAVLAYRLVRSRAAQRALAAAELDYRSIFDNALDGIYRSSPEGRQLRANPALVRLNGYESEADMLRSVNDISTEWYVEPGRRAEFMRILQQRGKVENFVSEIYRHKTRERIWISENARLVRDAQGRTLFYEGTVRDITDLKRAEDALVAARRAAEASDLAKSQLLANVSHELRTPLNAIIGFSEIMQHEMLGPLGESRYRDYAKDIRESGLHLLAIINDLLDLSKISAGRLELQEEVVRIGELFEDAGRFLRERAASAGLTLDIKTSSGTTAILGDRRALRQILLNLLSNAVKFTPAGGHVTLESAFHIDGAILFRVVDTGIGIAQADIPKALEPFGVVDNSLTRKYPGTGLGLAIVRGLVELHGGRLLLDSTPGVGTTVTVHLPPERVAPFEIGGSRRAGAAG